MALHGLRSVTIGVPDVDAAQDYYRSFGLTDGAPGMLATRDGGDQLRLVASPRRQLVEIDIAADDLDDIARITRRLAALDVKAESSGDGLETWDPTSGTRVRITVTPPMVQPASVPAFPFNAPGRIERFGARSPGALDATPVKPRRLGHLVVGTVDMVATRRFYIDGLGFKLSDTAGRGRMAFMRCSHDHHNIAIQEAPVNFLHHTAWQVENVDEIGRGATAMLDGHPERQIWGLGRHFIGSNFFWYLKDPAGNFSEYFSDMDYILDDELWTPEDFEGMRGGYTWGPPPSAQMIRPEDLAELQLPVS